VSGFVRNGNWQSSCLKRNLWRDTASPKNRQVGWVNGYRVSEVWLIEITYADLRRLANVNGCAMNRWEARANLDSSDDIRRGHRSHANYHVSFKGA
jgi:hypothetical protein